MILDDLKNMKDEWAVQRYFDKNYEGSCPCFSGSKKDELGIVKVHGRCWRVSTNAQDLHISGKHPQIKRIAREVKKKLDAQNWYNEYTIIFSKEKQ